MAYPSAATEPEIRFEQYRDERDMPGARRVGFLTTYNIVDPKINSANRSLPGIVSLIDKDLSEPYSVFTYRPLACELPKFSRRSRYFINNWPDLCFMTMQGERCVGESRPDFQRLCQLLLLLGPRWSEAIICKLDQHRCRKTHRGWRQTMSLKQQIQLDVSSS